MPSSSPPSFAFASRIRATFCAALRSCFFLVAMPHAASTRVCCGTGSPQPPPAIRVAASRSIRNLEKRVGGKKASHDGPFPVYGSCCELKIFIDHVANCDANFLGTSRPRRRPAPAPHAPAPLNKPRPRRRSNGAPPFPDSHLASARLPAPNNPRRITLCIVFKPSTGPRHLGTSVSSLHCVAFCCRGEEDERSLRLPTSRTRARTCFRTSRHAGRHLCRCSLVAYESYPPDIPSPPSPESVPRPGEPART